MPIFLVLVDEPGCDLRALPGYFHEPDSAIQEHVSFQDHPAARRFLVVAVHAQVGPVRPVESPAGPACTDRACCPAP